jgi:hypothetical protein
VAVPRLSAGFPKSFFQTFYITIIFKKIAKMNGGKFSYYEFIEDFYLNYS